MFTWYMLDAVIQVCQLLRDRSQKFDKLSGRGRFLSHHLFVCAHDLEVRWIRNSDVRILGDDDPFDRDDCQSIQRFEHGRMDRMGVLFRVARNSARVGIHGERG